MNQPYLTKQKLIAALLFITAFVIYSCRKDLTNNQQNPDNAIANARSWYQQTYPVKAGTDLRYKDINTLASETNGDLSQLIKPDWNSANVYEKQGRQVIEMPLDSAFKIGFTPPPANGKINSLNYNKLYSKTSFLILGNSQSYKAYIMTIIADSTWLAGDFSKLKPIAYNHKPADFSGKLIYLTPTGMPVSGYSYTNGKITGILSRVPNEGADAALKQNAGQTAKKSQGYSCTSYQVAVPAYWTCTYMQSHPETQYCIQYWNRITFTNCYFTPEIPQQQIDFIAPDELAGSPYSTVTEEIVPGQHQTIITTDSLKAKYPCAVKLIVDKLIGQKNFGEFIEPFLGEDIPNLKWNVSDTLEWHVANGNAGYRYMLGLTSVIGHQTSAEVFLNSYMLQNSSQLIIASVAIHETLHAFVNYRIQRAYYHYLDGNMSLNSWIYGLDSWYALSGLPSNYAGHYEMLDSYFDQAVNILAQWDNYEHSTDEYRMTMLFGLDNSAGRGSDPTMQNRLTTWYNLTKSKYGITDQALSNFWNTQLNALTSTRLPTTGCN